MPEVDVVGPLMNRERSGASLGAEVIFNALNTPAILSPVLLAHAGIVHIITWKITAYHER